MSAHADLKTGTVKSWQGILGIGHVAPDDAYPLDCFIAQADVPARDGKRFLKVGERVQFRIETRRCLTAVDLTFLEVTR